MDDDFKAWLKKSAGERVCSDADRIAQTIATLRAELLEALVDKARLDWLKAEPYERLQKVREWLPISYVPPAPDNLRAAIDNAMKHDPNFRP